MSEIRITELAEMTGFPPTTIRFYENAGLLPAAARTANGRRVYDEGDVIRLRFIARSKLLGLSLDDIRELVTGWDGGPGELDQEQLRATLLLRIIEVNQRITELSAFGDQLADVLDSIRQPMESGVLPR